MKLERLATVPPSPTLPPVTIMSKCQVNSIHWFRKCLRLHDNPALVEAVKNGQQFWPIFILDPWFVKNMRVGPNRWRFLVQSLRDLDESLKQFNSRLFVIRGKPTEVLRDAVGRWHIKYLTFESDTEPYARARDEEVENLMKALDVEVIKCCTNTLYDPERIIAVNGKVPLTYQAFVNSADKIGLPSKPVPSVDLLKDLVKEQGRNTPVDDDYDVKYSVPTLKEVNVNESELNPCLYPGGETEALARLERVTLNEEYICKFEKPNTSPNALKPSTTVLSPYLKFGCLSARTFYYKIRDIYLKSKVFEELLLDADWSLNAGNWMWLSASAFFHQYYRVYSPIAFGKKTDKNGDYIRKYIPVLKKFPPEYIYEPWKAPKKLQEQLGCVIGKDYPSPIVDHDKARVENLRRMDAVYKSKQENKDKDKKESPMKSKNSPVPKKAPSKGKRSLDGNSQNKISKFLKNK
ncbi:cryptochrome-1-like isoform X2 [Argiope bruennichi]|uniref:cryptochrome-1-like isoform X2 n=1 Tax=Argiope bruennichi TaxID=94029 RepID=UPI002494BB9D|nr:cryptochrome-1-like isoform X2 [Argiope bruennichi]